jgi:hypothetical protein
LKGRINMTIPPRALALLTGILLAVPYLASAQEDRFANVQVTATPVSGSVYMLTGQGGPAGR